jgi:hypothetical protein
MVETYAMQGRIKWPISEAGFQLPGPIPTIVLLHNHICSKTFRLAFI